MLVDFFVHIIYIDVLYTEVHTTSITYTEIHLKYEDRVEKINL